MENKKDYIILTDRIRQRIKIERRKRRIHSIHFSSQILGKSKGWLSHIERGIVEKIERENLEKIFENMLNISGEELDKYIADLVDDNEGITFEQKESEEDKRENEDKEEKAATHNLMYYKNTLFNDMLYNNLVNSLIKTIDKIYKNDKDYICNFLFSFLNNLELDSGFVLAYNRISLDFLNDMKYEEKQLFLNDISNIIKKYSDGSYKEILTKEDSNNIELDDNQYNEQKEEG